MTQSLQNYLSLVTSEHISKPKFVAFLSTLLQGALDTTNALLAMPSLYDLDAAVGDQLDTIGEWVGLSRTLPVPINGIYFSWDMPGLGWDQGIWYDPNNPAQGIAALTDDVYRAMLRVQIAANHWDGSFAGVTQILRSVFAGDRSTITFVQDKFDMTMTVGFVGAPSILIKELLTLGYINIRPAAVQLNFVASPGPVFGFDLENATISGWDVGFWT